MSEFQPPDIEEDRDAMWDHWCDQQEKNGMVVVSREELKNRLDRECTDAYAEGRADQQKEDQTFLTAIDNIAKGLLAWAYSELVNRSFDNMDDAFQMERIKQLIARGVRG